MTMSSQPQGSSSAVTESNVSVRVLFAGYEAACEGGGAGEGLGSPLSQCLPPQELRALRGVLVITKGLTSMMHLQERAA